MIDRIPPHDIAAEKSLLGSVMLKPDWVDDLSELTEADFYAEQNRLVYRAVSHMQHNNQPVDPVTLYDELSEMGVVDDVGGVAYLQDLMAAVPHAAHADYYAKIVMAKAKLRRLINTGNDLIRAGFSTSDPDHVDEAIQAAETMLTDMIESNGCQDEVINIGDVLLSAFDEIGEGRKLGTSTGFSRLDEVTGGMHGGQLIVLAARPGMGKSALAMAIALSLAKDDQAVLFHSLEMAKLEIAERVLSMDTHIPLSKMRRGELTSEDHTALAQNANIMSMYPLLIHENAYMTSGQIASSARLAKRKHDIQCLIVDYLQLIEPTDKRVSREQQVASITRDLKRLAKSLDIPVIALAQLNRNVESQKDKRPQLSDLRESGAIEQDADQVWLLYRASEYTEFTEDMNHNEWHRLRHDYSISGSEQELLNVAELFVRKNRSGTKGSVPLLYQGECVLFRNLATSVWD